MINTKLVSVITVTLNSARTLKDTLDSVYKQQDVSVEHIVKDGGSRDATLSIANNHPGAIRIIERADAGIYDAMNQGYLEANGDIICFLNSDDFFSDPKVLRDVVDAFNSSEADIVYGDLEVINDRGETIRKWRSGAVRKDSLIGQQLPHPSFFVRREALERIGLPFDPAYRISADFKQQLLLINGYGATTEYLRRTLVMMRHGGESSRSFSAIFRGWTECMQAYYEVTGRSGWAFVLGKVVRKAPQIRFFNRREPRGCGKPDRLE